MKKYRSNLEEIVPYYFTSEEWEIIPGPSGENNTTLFIRTNNEQYILRMYETHQDEDKVSFEHAVLLALIERPLTFSIPVPVSTIDGKTIVKTQSGLLAGLFKFIPGKNPALVDFDPIYSFGQAAGQLTLELATVSIDQPPVYKPYYDMDSTHPRCSLDQIKDFTLNPPEDFVELAKELLVIHKQLVLFQSRIPSFKKLPHQLVHGDLNASNILSNSGGGISAILDFEFVTNDLRVMEAAVSLSDFIHVEDGETMILKKITAFLTGYGSRVKLTEAEMDALPLLIQLRSIDVFIHFLGRYWDEVDSIDTVKKYIRKAALRISWITDHQEEFTKIL